MLRKCSAVLRSMAKKVNRNYQDLRSSLIKRGTNLRRFALQKGYPVATVYDAARGLRHGIVSMEILRQLEEAAYGN